MQEIRGKAKIHYPVNWKFKIICRREIDAEKTVADILELQPYRLTPSNKSKTAKYYAYSLEMQVLDETHMKNLYRSLGQHKDILKVL